MDKNSIAMFWIAFLLVPFCFVSTLGGIPDFLITLLAIPAIATNRLATKNWLLVPHLILGLCWLVVLITTKHWGFDHFILFEWFLLFCVCTSTSSFLYCLLKSSSCLNLAIKIGALSIFAGVIKANIPEFCVPSFMFLIMTSISIPVLVIDTMLCGQFLLDSFRQAK